MRQWKSFTAAIFMAMILATASSVAAQDTSPYLAGTWESGVYTETAPYTREILADTTFEIVNPGTRPVVVYSVYYTSQGVYIPTSCRYFTIQPNGLWRTYFPNKELPPEQFEAYNVGTAKFFAFPTVARQFDPNTVIGGFESKDYNTQEWETDQTGAEYRSLDWSAKSQANLKAVVITSSTIGEFRAIPNDCQPFVEN